MKNIKLLILFCILIISKNCACQSGTSQNLSSAKNDNYTSASLLFSAVNVTISTMNILNIKKEGMVRSSAGYGVLTGISQIIYGLIYKPKLNSNEYVKLNIVLGCVTLSTSCFRLYKNASKKNKATSWNLYYVPFQTNKFGVGISLTRKI
jgi:hypothetical protein